LQATGRHPINYYDGPAHNPATGDHDDGPNDNGTADNRPPVVRAWHDHPGVDNPHHVAAHHDCPADHAAAHHGVIDGSAVYFPDHHHAPHAVHFHPTGYDGTTDIYPAP
jgi:hypothetical protein